MRKVSFSLGIIFGLFYSAIAQQKMPYGSVAFHIGSSIVESKKFPVFYQPNVSGYDAKRLSLTVSGGFKYSFTVHPNISIGLLNNCEYFTVNDKSYCLQNSIDGEFVYKLSSNVLYFPLKAGFTNLSYFSAKSYSGNGFNLSLGSGYSVNRIISISCSYYMHKVVFKNMLVDVLKTMSVSMKKSSENERSKLNAGGAVERVTKNITVNYNELALHAIIQIPCGSHHNQNQP